MNNITLMGRLTADPVLKMTSSNIAHCRCTIAVDKPTKKGEEKATDFIPVTAWKTTAELIAKYFTKGSPIIVVGSLHNSDYTDNKGVKHYGFEVTADRIHFLPKTNTKTEAAPAAAPATTPALTPELMAQVMAAMGKTSTP